MDAPKQRALVTGASSGLGVEIARALAKRGIDLVISARREDRLRALAEELKRERGVDVVVMTADLSTTAGVQDFFNRMQAAGLKIDILVNNAGFGLYGPMLKQTLDQVQEIIAVNVIAPTILTHLFADAMRKQGGGYILEVSSFAGLQPIPKYSVYSAAKAYIIALTQALRHELRSSKVSVSVVAPGFMTTEFHDVAHHEKTFLMKVMTVPVRWTARRAVSGMFRRKLLITPGILYGINRYLLLPFLPRRMASGISAAIVKE